MTTAERLFNEALECDKNKDYEQAFTLYLAAAELGYAPAYPNVGYGYLNGEGTEKDYAKAVEFFKKGVDAGNLTSFFNLGVCYSNGYGVPQDKQKALELYKKVADAGNELGKKSYENLKKELSSAPPKPSNPSTLKFEDLMNGNFGNTNKPQNDTPVDTGVGGLGFSNWSSPSSSGKPAGVNYVRKLKNRIAKNYVICWACAAICAAILWFGGSTDNIHPVLILAMVFTLYPGIGGIIAIPGYIKRMKHLKSLEHRGLLELAAREVFTGKTVPFGEKALLSDHFLFRNNKRGFIIPCEDVLWFYTGKTTRYCDYYIGTRYLGVKCFSGLSRYTKIFDSAVNAHVRQLQSRTKDLLINNTPENKAEYNRRKYQK